MMKPDGMRLMWNYYRMLMRRPEWQNLCSRRELAEDCHDVSGSAF